jgi:hypothetical protein
MASPLLAGSALYPATIDYHDTRVGMTFLAGHLLPTRVFRYADYPRSATASPIPELPARAVPTLVAATVGKGSIIMHWQAPEAVRYGIALWSNPHNLHLAGPGITLAGRAGAVVTFDLRPGENRIEIPCGACKSDTLEYAS